jgi:hypothetical protein
MHIEGDFVSKLRALFNDPRGVVPREGLGARLRDAWQRLESRCMLQRRNIDQGAQVATATCSTRLQAAHAAAADPGLRHCALVSCNAREAHPDHFKSCAACRIPVYCSKEHQSEDWPSHKAACKAARKKAAAVADDGAGPSGA